MMALLRPRCCLLSSLLLLVLWGCSAAVPEPSITPAPAVARTENDDDIKAFCGACHRLPEPRSFAAADWRKEVLLGFRLFEESGRTDLHPPPRERVVAYYAQRAPRELRFDGPEQVTIADRPSPLQFEAESVTVAGATEAPAVARIDEVDGTCLIADMRGVIWRWQPGAEQAERLWKVPHPAACTVVKLHADAPPGIVIGDLGTFYPEDRHRGALWWADSLTAPKVRPIMDRLSRVSHVASNDLDGDGRNDLVISEFGWRKTGRLAIGWNDPDGSEFPWSLRVLDPRHGCLKTVVCDFDGNGQLDIVAAFAQEHETVDVFRPVGPRQFERATLSRAPDPTWGTSDFEVVDLDGDRRLDVILCHGDNFDSPTLHPFHGIRWLRQRDDGSVEEKFLAGMPGVLRAIPADLDGDGDLDIAAASLLPSADPAAPPRPKLASVVWLEQTTAGEFVPHVLEWDRYDHATCAVMDADGDGRLDIVVGHFHWTGDDPRLLTVYQNQGPSEKLPQ